MGEISNDIIQDTESYNLENVLIQIAIKDCWKI